MKLGNHARALIVCLAVLPGGLLASCAANWQGEPASAYDRVREGRANDPIGIQTGRLTVVALDHADGGPLFRATVDIVAGTSSIMEPMYYRRVGVSDRRGMVSFNDVPQVVNLFITHSRGIYAVENYRVPQSGISEFRVYIETTSPRTREECLGQGLCGP